MFIFIWTLTVAPQARDNLTGTDEYGESDCAPTAACTFSVPFKDVAWREALVASGDGARWLQLERSWLWLHGRRRGTSDDHRPLL